MASRPAPNISPGMTFVYVSGQGTDSTGKGRFMWARVKGETEKALLALPFKAVMFRPGFIQPLHGITSRAGPTGPSTRARTPTIWKEHGALGCTECLGEDLQVPFGLGFRRLARLKSNEPMPFDQKRFAMGGFEVLVGW